VFGQVKAPQASADAGRTASGHFGAEVPRRSRQDPRGIAVLDGPPGVVLGSYGRALTVLFTSDPLNEPEEEEDE